MRYSDSKKIFFVHIPKCGGKSVGRAIDGIAPIPLAEIRADLGVPEEGFSQNRRVHPILGPIHPMHLPLAVMEEHFPRIWALFTGSDSFAIARDPRQRFISALTQRMMEFKDSVAPRLDDPSVRHEAEQVCAWLDGRQTFADLEYIHFSRQIDFTHLHGEQRISRVFPIERVGALVDWLAREHGVEIEMTAHHTRREPRKWVAGLQPTIRALARNGLPRRVREAIYPLWSNSGLFTPAAARYDEVSFAPEVETFIAHYYAEDAALHRRALEDAAAEPAAG